MTLMKNIKKQTNKQIRGKKKQFSVDCNAESTLLDLIVIVYSKTVVEDKSDLVRGGGLQSLQPAGGEGDWLHILGVREILHRQTPLPHVR